MTGSKGVTVGAGASDRPIYAVDAGGSSTMVLAFDGSRRIWPSVNPAAVGNERTARHLRDVMMDISDHAAATDPGGRAVVWFASASLDPRSPDDEVAGIALVARAAGFIGDLIVSNDVTPLVLSLSAPRGGVVAVCGTGSGFLAGDGRRLPVQVGGCEYLASDEGSAFDLGRRGLQAAVRGLDGRGPRTTLIDRLAAAGTPVPSLARQLALDPLKKAAVAALAPLVTRAWIDGDSVAAAVVRSAVGELVLGVRSARDAAGLTPGWHLVVAGGVMTGCPAFYDEFVARAGAPLGASSVSLTRDPAAAVLEALRATVHPTASGCPTVGSAVTPGVSRYTQPELGPQPRWASWRDLTAMPDGDAPIDVGVCLAAFGGTPLTSALATVRSLDFSVIDLPTDSVLGLADVTRLEAEPRYRAAVLDALTSTEIHVACVSNSRDAQLLLGPNGAHTDAVMKGSSDEKRSHGLRAALATVRFAADLGAGYVRLMLGCPDHARWLDWWGSNVRWSDNIEMWIAETAPVLDAAAAAGVRLLVEPHPKQVAFDRPSTEDLLAVTASWKGLVNLCVDPANLAAIGHDPVDGVRAWGDRLAAVHVKDLQRWTGRGRPQGPGWCRYGPQPHVRFRTLGAGELPWSSIVSALLDESFTGSLYIEHEDVLLPRRQAIANASEQLRALLPMSQLEGRTW